MLHALQIQPSSVKIPTMSIKQNIPTLDLDYFKVEFQNYYRLLNHAKEGRNQISKPHKHDFFLFFLINNGGGTHCINHKTFKVADQQLHILLPDQIHQWDLTAETTGFQFMINQDILHALADSTYFNFIRAQQLQVIDLRHESFKSLLQEFKALEAELLSSQENNWRLIYTRSQLITLLIEQEIRHHYQVEVTSKIPQLLLKYQTLINRNFAKNRQVSYYANLLHITPNYLNILCRKHFDCSALSLIQNRTIQEAKMLLQYSNSSIKEIAFNLGFRDVSYFSNFFKSQLGISPRSFKEKPL